MSGRNSVAIAIDARFGLGMQTIATMNTDGDDASDGNPRIVLLPNSNTLLAWTGLYGDGISFAEEMNVLMGRKLRRSLGMGFDSGSERRNNTLGKKMSPRAITMLMSHLLYRRRSAPYYVEPVVVGLENVRVPVSVEGDDTPQSVEGRDAIPAIGEGRPNSESLKLLESISRAHSTQRQLMSVRTHQPIPNKQSTTSAITSTPTKQQSYRVIQKPYLVTTDMLGAQSTSTSFVCSGVASRSLHGTAEALWRPNLEGEELVEVCGRAFVSALERDCLSGYGAVVYLIQGRGDGSGDENDVVIMEYVLACRND